MEFLGTLDNFQKIGFAGLPIIGFVLYQLWRLWKQDNKSDNVDARIQAYSAALQAQLDKMGVAMDTLRSENIGFIKENAKLAASLEVAVSNSLLKDAKIAELTLTIARMGAAK